MGYTPADGTTDYSPTESTNGTVTITWAKVIGRRSVPLGTISGFENLMVNEIAAIKVETEDKWSEPCDHAGFDKKLFDIEEEYGEAGLAVANKVADMGNLDRIIFEDCHDGSGGIQRQSINVPTVSKANRPEILARRLKCNYDEAEDFIDFFNIIDPECSIRESLVIMVLQGIGKYGAKSGITKALAYFSGLAGELVDVVDESQLTSFDPSNDWQEEVSDENEFETVEPEDWQLRLENQWAGAIDRSIRPVDIDCANVIDIDEAKLTGFIDRNIWTDPSGNMNIDKPFSTPPMLRYANMNDDASQPHFGAPTPVAWNNVKLFTKMLILTKSAKLAAVNKWRAAVGSKSPKMAWMNYHQRSAFWEASNTRQEDLHCIIQQWVSDYQLTPKDRQLIKQFEATKSIAQAKFYYGKIARAAKSDRNTMGSKRFIEHFLKPALSRRFEILKNADSAPRDDSGIPADDSFAALINSMA